jgi:hypothetical protein
MTHPVKPLAHLAFRGAGAGRYPPRMALSLEAEATQFLQARFPRAVTMHVTAELRQADGANAKPISIYSAIDHRAGVKQLLLCVSELGDRGEARSLAAQLDELRRGVSGVTIDASNAHDPHANVIKSDDLVWSPIVVLFTDTLCVEIDSLRAAFAGVAVLEISDAKSRAILDTLPRGRLSTVFISYGGPDVVMATRINDALLEKGVKTWFFPVDAKPGDKLHRVMNDAVEAHDRTLLLCSKSSLVRSGVLNELERVLEREAREGGAAILIPIRLDDFVFSDWSPARPDQATQVRSRIIGDLSSVETEGKFEKEMRKVIAGLATVNRTPDSR